MNANKLLLSGNNLKIIAAIAMAIDHFGLIFFPDVWFLRMIGRLAFPIFAFFIAEGCKYTHDRVRYLTMIAGMGILFQIVYFIFLQSLYMCVFVTFSFSIVLIYLLDACKKAYLQEKNIYRQIGSILAFLLALIIVYLINNIQYKDFGLDGGFWGCLAPLFASLFHAPKDAPEGWKKLDKPHWGALAMAIPLLGLSISFLDIFPLQFFSLVGVLLLLLYSGKRGKRKMKYFFYIFYPAHLVILYGIFYFLYLL